MRKAEFLKELEECLSEELSQGSVRDNLIYYDRYITTEVSSGRTEDEVLEELGSPRLIAKTIVEAAEAAGEASYGPGGSAYSDADYSGSGSGYSGGSYEDDRNMQNPWGSTHYFDLNKWYVKYGIIIALIVILLTFITIVGGIFTLLAPVAGPIMLAYLVYIMMRRR